MYDLVDILLLSNSTISISILFSKIPDNYNQCSVTGKVEKIKKNESTCNFCYSKSPKIHNKILIQA